MSDEEQQIEQLEPVKNRSIVHELPREAAAERRSRTNIDRNWRMCFLVRNQC